MRPGVGICLALAVTLAGGCGGPPTSLALSLSVQAGLPMPDSLEISLFGQGRVGAPVGVPLASAGHTLPGTVVLGPLDPVPPDFRVVVDGIVGGATAEQAAAPVALQAGVQNRLALVLGAPLPDADGDGVPDVVDDCPTLADPDQSCAAPDAGDLSASVDSGDGFGDGGGAPACPPGALFCDDFETGDTTKWDGKVLSGLLDTIQVDAIRPLHGTYSADARGLAGGFDLGLAGAQTAALAKAIIPTVGGSLWARTYVYFSQPPAPNEQVLALTAGGTLGYQAGIGSAGSWALYEDGAVASQASGAAPPGGSWICLELGVDLRNNIVTLAADGQTLIHVKLRQTAVPSDLELGLVEAPATAARIFFDDVAAATSRIGCE